LILDRDAHPHVLRPFKLRAKLSKTMVSLCEDLECMPFVCPHYFKDLADEGNRDLFVEKVAHAVDKYESGGFPGQWELEPVWVKLDRCLTR
jgi:hypothetical protein